MNDETITAREAARRRMPLDGADAQALEGALAMTERERDDARASLAQVRRNLNTMIRVHDKTVRERDAERDAEREIREAMETLLREVERERDALKRHYDAAGPEHNLLALLDLYETRREELDDERNATNSAIAACVEFEAALGMLREERDAMMRELDGYSGRLEEPESVAWPALRVIQGLRDRADGDDQAPTAAATSPRTAASDARRPPMSDAQTDRSMRYAAGYVDRLGYLRCASCASDTQRDTTVRSAPHIDEPCDLCGRVLGAPANEGALVADAEAADD